MGPTLGHGRGAPPKDLWPPIPRGIDAQKVKHLPHSTSQTEHPIASLETSLAMRAAKKTAEQLGRTPRTLIRPQLS